MSKVLLLTIIDSDDFEGYEDLEMTSAFKDTISEEFGFNREKMVFAYVFCSQAMNGSNLYVEIVSEDIKALEKVHKLLLEASVKTSDDIGNWIAANNISLIETEGNVGVLDEYLFDFEG